MTWPIAYATPARRAELRAMPYADYLRTAEWAQVRWHALNEARYRCRMCSCPTGLEVHHRDYTDRGAEQPGDVFVICDGCHERHHAARPPVVDQAGAAPREMTPGERELDRLRCDIIAARERGDHAEADRLTIEREALWRSLARGRR